MTKPLLLGLGVSGFAVAKYFEKKNLPYYVYDENFSKIDFSEFKHVTILRLEEVFKVEYSFLIVSPGVHPNHPIYRRAIEEKKEIIGEVELALRLISCPVIGITGTNGKTTVTKFIAEGLTLLGYEGIPCGNFGLPLISLVEDIQPNTVLCCELSSYQLETISQRKLDFGILLNITQDHLDRYETMQDYANAKLRMIDLIKDSGKMFIQKQVQRDFFVKEAAKSVVFYDDQSINLPFLDQYGKKEKENWIAAFLVLKEFKMSSSQMQELLNCFQKPRHRIELVETIDGVSYFDDSKGTNVDAVVFAVEKFRFPILLLVGGKDKGSDYTPWIHAFKGKVKKIFAYGSAREKIYQVLHPYFPIEMVEKLEDVMTKVQEESVAGDSVLLSPGCSSFDQFKDYVHRSEVFKQCVSLIASGKK
jgi:UDP-N-acetylmuramoylalanine--D-glutamate ligase